MNRPPPHSAAQSFQDLADAGSNPTPDHWPLPMGEDARIGLAGDFVGVVAPQSEADPTALLVQFLVAFANACGRSPHFMAEADRHSINLFAVMVGETSKGRKGTSWGQVRRVIGEADLVWLSRIASGLSSGEGLIWQVRDSIEKAEPEKDKAGNIIGHEIKIVDPGIEDKRFLAFEGEFASVLTVAGREGSTLSPIIRCAWDTGDLRSLTKNTPAKATGAHISIVGHVTREELTRHLTDTQAANGFGNRFLWVCTRRSKLLPEGGMPDPAAITELIERTRQALAFARDVTLINRDEEARKIWHRVYAQLSEGKAGLLGCMVARAEAQVMRMACIYALLDCSHTIRAEHLTAALTVWRYCEDSARFIFSDALGDPVADTILTSLRQTRAGLTKTDISALFGRNISAARIDAALKTLAGRGLARRTSDASKTGPGRQAERWTT